MQRFKARISDLAEVNEQEEIGRDESVVVRETELAQALYQVRKRARQQARNQNAKLTTDEITTICRDLAAEYGLHSYV